MNKLYFICNGLKNYDQRGMCYLRIWLFQFNRLGVAEEGVGTVIIYSKGNVYGIFSGFIKKQNVLILKLDLQ